MADIVFELFRAVVIGIILTHLWWVGRNESIRQQQGWGYILTGFLLLFFGMLVDITDNFPGLNKYVVIGDTETEAFLEKVVGYLFGFTLLAVGFWKWMPTVISLRTTQRQLKEHRDELEKRVDERTAEIGRLSRVVEESPVSVIITDIKGNIEYVNPFFTQTTGYSAEEVVGRNPRIFNSGHTPPEKYQELWRTITSGQVWRGVFQNKRKDGSLVWEAATIAPIKDRGGKISNFVALKEDITKRKEAEESLMESEARFRSIFQSAAAAMIVVVDENGVFSEWNIGAERAFGYSARETVGKPLTMLMPERYREAHIKGFARAVGQGGLSHSGVTHELSGLRKNGQEFPLELTLGSWKKDGKIYFSAFILDITERKEAEKEIRQLALTDPLTGLANRNQFNTRLEEALRYARRFGQHVGLMLLDLDKFKAVNDAYGHPVGDALLKWVSDSLNEIVREVDTVARLGGDEFAIVLNGVGESYDVSVPAEKIIAKLSEPVTIKGHKIQISTSIGVSFFNKDETGPKELIQKADKALYQAKHEGRNTFRIQT